MKIRRLIAAGIGALALTAMTAFPSLAAGWKQDGTGYWFEREDNSYPAGAWEQIDSKWYLFDRNGYMLTGWQQDNGSWYYLGTDGAMAAGTTMTIDGISYTFDNSGAMQEQEDADMTMGRWAGATFVNEWSNIRLTVPQGFTTLDSSSLSRISGDGALMGGAVIDMAAMKNQNCAIMVIYMPNTDKDAIDSATAFLNMFMGGSFELKDKGRIESLQVGSLCYLRCYFPPAPNSSLCGYMYLRNIGNRCCMILALSDEAEAAVLDSVLSTLGTAR